MDALAALQLKKRQLKQQEELKKQKEIEEKRIAAVNSIAEQKRLNALFGFPREPGKVFSIVRGISAAVWWTYDEIELESIIGWEVMRYRKDPNQRPNSPPVWQYKGSHNFTKLEKLQVVIEELATSQEYRFSVKAINEKGKSVESEPSNTILVELPLPSGWFRFYDDKLHRPYYASLKSNRSSWSRPETIPYFIEDEIFLNFEQKELKNLKSLYDEDIAHFQSINVDQFLDILREIGERSSKGYVKRLFLTYANDLQLKEWSHYMEIVNHFKLQHLNRQPIASCHLFQIFFQRSKVRSVLPPDRNKLGTDWEVEYNSFAERLYYRNVVTGECSWHMPDVVKFFVPPALEEKLSSLFDYYEIEELKRSFSLLDIDNSGDLSENEIKLLLQSMGIRIPEKKLKKLVKAIDINSNGTIEFDEFCWMMYEIKKKERQRHATNGSGASSPTLQRQLSQLSRESSIKSNSSPGGRRWSSIFQDETWRGKFNFRQMETALQTVGKAGRGRIRRASSFSGFSFSSYDDSENGSQNRRGGGCFPVFGSGRKILAGNGEDDESNSLFRLERQDSLRSLDSEGKDRKEGMLAGGKTGKFTRGNSMVSMMSDDASSSSLMSYGVVTFQLNAEEHEHHHHHSIRRKSSFRDLSEEATGNKYYEDPSKRHSKYCFCGCRRY